MLANGPLKMIYTTALLLASTGIAARGQSVPPPVSSTAPMPNAKKKPENRKGDTRRSFSLNEPISTAPGDAYDNSIGKPLLKHLLLDQKAIWTSPSRLRSADADWLLPLGALTGGLLATDTTASKNLTNSPAFIQHSRDFSNYGVASFVGVGGGMYLWGKISHNDHARETGLLAGEAAIDSLAVTER